MTRTCLVASVGAIFACHPLSTESLEPKTNTPTAEISPTRCVRYSGEARDPSLLGTPRTDQRRCCEHDFGFDPQLARRSCGFGKYLGESEELACVHRFEGDEGELIELRVTPMVGLDFEAAIARHESGDFDVTHLAGPPPEHPALWISTDEARHWALVDRWPDARRLTWAHAACSPTDMLPVLAAMSEQPPPSEALTPLPRLTLDQPRAREIEHSLLTHYLSETPPETGPYALPRSAAKLVAETMRAAATEDREAFARVLTEDARWGLPDRRQLSGRPILDVDGDDGAAAMFALRQSAARMPAQLELHCPRLDRRVVPAVARGEALMWCVWASVDSLDLLVFAIRGHIIGGQADGRVEYIGLFPDLPRRALMIPGEPPPPPMRPRPSIICGDPHAVDYPELCPDPDPDPDPSGE